MPQPNQTTRPRKRNTQLASVLMVALITLLAVVYHQWIVDAFHYVSYQPSKAVASISQTTNLTDTGKFYFYASRPDIAGRSTFNDECQRMEADSPVLGCYVSQRIYIFDVTNKQLSGIEEVTAAHELLHAVWERMSDADRNKLSEHLQSDYKKVRDKDLIERMKYYKKYEPGEENNELFSILGTEFRNLSAPLEKEYAKYFADRLAIVSFHENSQAVFDRLSNKAASLASRLNSLIDGINQATERYNTQAKALEQQIAAFNTRAQQQGGFSTQGEFDAARAQLLTEVERLKATRARINSDITLSKKLRSELEAVAAESSALNKSIDSNLAPAAEL